MSHKLGEAQTHFPFSLLAGQSTKEISPFAISKIEYEDAKRAGSALPVKTVSVCQILATIARSRTSAAPPLHPYISLSRLLSSPKFSASTIPPPPSLSGNFIYGANSLQCFTSLRVRSLHDVATSTSCHFHPARCRLFSSFHFGPEVH